MTHQDLVVRLRPPYPIRYRASFRAVWDGLAADHPGRDIFAVVDRGVLDRHPEVERWVRRRPHVAVRGGEPAKSVRQWERLHRAAAGAGLGRDGLVVAIGGGSVGDLAGFFAATWMRGVDWCPVATTVLSLADSATGGKTAVNLGGAKNLVGAFHQPVAVYGVTGALSTLPVRQLRSGMAEIVKSGWIADPALVRDLESAPPRLTDWTDTDWLPRVQAAARVKARIVAADPREGGRRALLNFGHTLGHALESTLRPRPTHGEAVALGMVAAAHLSTWRDLVDPAQVQRLEDLLGRFGLPIRRAGIDLPGTLDAVSSDKKSRGRRPRMVLTEGRGVASFGHQIERRELRRALQVLGSVPPR